MVPIYRGSDYIEAHLLTGLLRQRGIKVFLQGALLQGGIGDLPALGHLTIMVDEEDRVAAKRILAAYERGELQIEDETHDESDFDGQEERGPAEDDIK
ncbi:DUF2007 domain-containing protein [Steroidobacter sp.]|uniref:putative signal transducing protein n=1 Tax=Steroidobacter sp. TaxID=1978227 RepID=UPI002EDA76FB